METTLETLHSDIASSVASATTSEAIKKSKILSNGTFVDFLKLLFKTVQNSTHGKILFGIWGCAPGVAFYLFWKKSQARKKWKELDRQREQERSLLENPPQEEKSKEFRSKLFQLLTVIFPSITSKSGMYIVIYTAILCSRVWITIKLASLVGELGSLMGKREFQRMFLQQARFGLWCYPAAITNSLMKFFEKKIALQFRTELTKFIHDRYISDQNFYQILLERKLDNLDQRITADVDTFCSTLTFIYGHILKPVLDTLFLSHSLGKLLGYRQLALFYFYFFTFSAILSTIKPNFSRLVAEKQRLEGFFRADHTRIIQYSEEIAFLSGAERERKISEKTYSALADHVDKSLWTHLFMDILDSYIMKYGGNMMAYTVVIPSVFVNWKMMTSQQAMQHYLTATTMLLGLGNALKDIVLSYKEVAKLEGLTNRVYALYHEIVTKWESEKQKNSKNSEKSGDSVRIIRNPSIDYIELQNCDISTPNGITQLIRNISFRINPGEHVLISGINGTGKSSLFRTLGGLWPLRRGVMKLPPKDQIYFVSQNSYMCPGTLQDLVTYPECYSSDEKLHEILRGLFFDVELTSVLERFGFEGVENWAGILSGGEKQRIVIARLFYHKPKFGVLDECTSAISVEMEDKIFQLAKELGITLVTIAHKEELEKHHKYRLGLKGGGMWEWERIEG